VALSEAVLDPSYAVEFWDITNRQDWRACESVQRGVSSPHFRPGPAATNEDAVYDWVSMVARAYRDPLAELGTGTV
jgi:Rieske 2Fe-2S family protein